MLAVPVDMPPSIQNDVLVEKHQKVEFVQPPVMRLLKKKMLVKDGRAVVEHRHVKTQRKHKVPARESKIDIASTYKSCQPKFKSVYSVDFKMGQYKTKLGLFRLHTNACYLVRGYASPEGSETFNYELSMKRAQFVTHKLKKSYPDAQFEFKGYGEGCGVGRKVIVEELPCAFH